MNDFMLVVEVFLSVALFVVGIAAILAKLTGAL